MFSGKGRHLLYLLFALAMVIYALPRLELSGPLTLASAFGLVWLGLALVVSMAHVNALFLMDEEKRKELERIKRAKAMLWERKLLQKATASRRVRG